MKISKVIFHIKPIPSHPWWECKKEMYNFYNFYYEKKCSTMSIITKFMRHSMSEFKKNVILRILIFCIVSLDFWFLVLIKTEASVETLTFNQERNIFYFKALWIEVLISYRTSFKKIPERPSSSPLIVECFCLSQCPCFCDVYRAVCLVLQKCLRWRILAVDLWYMMDALLKNHVLIAALASRFIHWFGIATLGLGPDNELASLGYASVVDSSGSLRIIPQNLRFQLSFDIFNRAADPENSKWNFDKF